jgi:glucan phosphoethanolaminetransferase (alkaline phosphatase superfamily)
MKRIVLTFGVISGLISAVMMLATIPFMHKISSDKGLIIGYTTIVLAGLLVFFGIRSYRDNVSGGTLTFGRAFAVGLLISLLSNCFYVGAWEVVSNKFMPDFAEKYAAQMVEHAKATGASQQKIEETARQGEDFVRNYHKPLYKISMTFLEPFPVFLVITLISAAFLRRKRAPATA